MGTYLSAALQVHHDEDELTKAHWETVAEFFFWKDYDLSTALEDAKDHFHLSAEISVELYREMIRSLGSKHIEKCRYQVFELSELPNPVKVYDGQISFKYHALLNAALACKIVNKTRVVFWRDQ